jgi:hypothetical protein
MLRIIVGIFFVLHGLVHLLYFGQSGRLFELRPEMIWPDNSWAFVKLLGNETTRVLASILLILAAIGFVAGGIGVFARQAWWRPLVVGAAAFSAMIYLLLWDGRLQNLSDKGGVGILIDAVMIGILLFLQWPGEGF